MKKIIFLGLLIASLASYSCESMFKKELSFPSVTGSDCSDIEEGQNQEKDENFSLSLINQFKLIPGFNVWFNKIPTKVQRSMELYYDTSNEFNEVIGIDSLYHVFFLNLSNKDFSLIKSVPINDEGSFDDIDSELIKYRNDEIAFHNKFRLIQISLFTVSLRFFLKVNPAMNWQQLVSLVQGLRDACSKNQFYSQLPNGRKSRMICYVLFRSAEQVRRAILFYQANNGLSDKQVEEIVKKKEAEKARFL